MHRIINIIILLTVAVLSVNAQVKLDTITVAYVDVNGVGQKGQIVCNHIISEKLKRIFGKLYKAGYRIERIVPISEYGDDDEHSMTANNTSCYCNRGVAGSKTPSKHALGLAVDINPLYNPYIRFRDNLIQPKAGKPYVRNRTQDKTLPVTKIDHNDLAYKLFHEEGFIWGGDWRTVKDYQHFEYPQK